MDKMIFLLSEGMKNLCRHKLTAFTSVFSIFLTLTLAGSLIIVSDNTGKIIQYLRDKYKIEVFFIIYSKLAKFICNFNQSQFLQALSLLQQ